MLDQARQNLTRRHAGKVAIWLEQIFGSLRYRKTANFSGFASMQFVDPQILWD